MAHSLPWRYGASLGVFLKQAIWSSQESYQVGSLCYSYLKHKAGLAWKRKEFPHAHQASN